MLDAIIGVIVASAQPTDSSGPPLVDIIRGIVTDITIAGWITFALTWVTGWLIKGVAVPSQYLKMWGTEFTERAMFATFWLSIGTTIISLISWVATNGIAPSLPQGPASSALPPTTGGAVILPLLHQLLILVH